MSEPEMVHADCPLRCRMSKDLVRVRRPRHAWRDIIICPNQECDVEGGRCWLVPPSLLEPDKEAPKV